MNTITFQISRAVAYSPFHFARIFKERIGLPPLYYVSSLRLQKAKELLLHTNLSIRDIGLEIGQQSLGTFTTRFTERVGVRPSDFRNSMLSATGHLKSLQELSVKPAPHLGLMQNCKSLKDGLCRIVTVEEGELSIYKKLIPRYDPA